MCFTKKHISDCIFPNFEIYLLIFYTYKYNKKSLIFSWFSEQKYLFLCWQKWHTLISFNMSRNCRIYNTMTTLRTNYFYFKLLFEVYWSRCPLKWRLLLCVVESDATFIFYMQKYGNKNCSFFYQYVKCSFL